MAELVAPQLGQRIADPAYGTGGFLLGAYQYILTDLVRKKDPAKSRIKQNEIQKTEVQRSIEREVRNLVADLNSSLKRLQLLEKNVKVAEKSFEITLQRFTDGDIDSQALALERNRLNNAYNSHLRAYINYQLMQAELMRKTFYDFQRNEAIK